MASRGLPGFLRRSARAEYSEDDDDEPNENKSVSSNDSASSLPEAEQSNVTDLTREQHLPQSIPTVLDSRHNWRSFTIDNSFSSCASLPPIKMCSKPAAFNRQSSQPRILRASHLQQSEEVEIDRAIPLQTAATLNDKPAEAKPKTYREMQFERIFAADVMSMNDLKTLAWNGIPPQQRPLAWKILLGYLPTNASRRLQTVQRKRAEYKDAIAQHYDVDDNSRTIQEQEVLRQVLVDVPRTAPTVKLFRDQRIKRLLTRILYIWAMRHPASSYVQGINDLAMPLIVTYLTEVQMVPETHDAFDVKGENGRIDYEAVLEGAIMDTITDNRLHEVEADCYWCLTNLLAGIQDHYTSDQPGVQRMVLRLEELVRRIDADLATHFNDTGIEFMQFAFKWMNCLLLREFTLKCVIRLWDTYISEKDGFRDFHVYVCAAFLCQFSGQLQDMTFDELFQFMQAIPTCDWGDTEIEMLLSQAYVLTWVLLF